MKATVAPELIEVIHSTRGEEHWLTISVPNGWGDVKKICKKVLEFEGRNYTFRGWNSDRNDCMFLANNSVATIKSK